VFTNDTRAVTRELTDLLTHLEAGYRKTTTQPLSVTCGAEGFFDWARAYLTENRPSEVFPVDNNYGVLLTNGQRIKLCPELPNVTTRTGDMANPDASISINRQF
jgi:hypothetical protein